MGQRSKRPGARQPGQQKQASVDAECVKVRAVKAGSGRAATAIEVEVDPDRMRQQVGAPAEVHEIVAEVPVASPRGDVRWEAERLAKLAEQTRAPGRRVLRYAATHYGAADAARGVKVRVKTTAGTVETGSGDVRDSDKPRHPPR